ncbi:MAG: NifB/NifX family molybdenum-iron cluster-binding protein [Bacteroidota bacterium]|nr:NifB/NifX family molybdenum-iron cluster-binding protein [Bacteroidota bacterium]
MKIIAIPVLDNKLAQHFGHAPYFFLYELNDGKIVKQRMEQAPEHTHGSIPNFLISLNVTDLIIGGVGGKAIEILNSGGINVFSGAESKSPAELVAEFISGELNVNTEGCSCGNNNHDYKHHHEHSH